MDELPGEMVVAVLGWVEAPDLVASHQVCRRWHHLLSAHLGASAGSGLWRGSYLRTWPPPLSSAAHHAVIATAAHSIDWRALCLQRIGLLRHCTLPPPPVSSSFSDASCHLRSLCAAGAADQQARMAEVAALLRSAATLAAPAPAPLGAEPEEAPEELTHGTTGAPAEKKKTKRKAKGSDNDKPKKRKKRSTRKRKEGKDSKEKKKQEKKKRKRTSSSSLGSASSEEEDRKVKKVKKDKKKAKKKRREEETEDSAEAELQAAHQRHIADVQGPVEKAQQVLAYLNRVAGLRQRAHQLLHSYPSYDAIISCVVGWLAGCELIADQVTRESRLQGKASADEKPSKEHLLAMLFRGNMLYAKIHHKYLASPPPVVMRMTLILTFSL